MWVMQVQKDLVDLSKHCIHETDALVSLGRSESFALENTRSLARSLTHSLTHSLTLSYMPVDIVDRAP